jgi:YVTN family beta-propeller protein
MQGLDTRSGMTVLAIGRLAARCARTLLPAILLLFSLFASLQAKEQEIHPVYVGSTTCVSCHQSETMGQQFTKWFQSAHARAYASLAKPEAHKIAELSGIPLDPQKSATCLGCHTTGAQAEDWEKDPTFHLQDGVQCEKCHGPGSEYANVKTMTNREAAVQAGLIIPKERDCMGCHLEKGSHVAVLNSPPFDVTQALKAIAHPTPDDWSLRRLRFPEPSVQDNNPAQHVGAHACAECHDSANMGHQYSGWLESKHADAFSVLGTEAAKKIAAENGVKGSPQTDPNCLKCHGATYQDPAGGSRAEGLVYQGVNCESCHGAASQYMPADGAEGAKCGGPSLKKVTRDTCAACHEDAHGKPFDYDQALKAIAHPTNAYPASEVADYKTPLNLEVRPGGGELYVTCEASHSVIVIDTATQEKVAEIATGHQATEVTFHPDGSRAYVSCRLDDLISVIDTQSREVIASLEVGDEPHGLLTDREGKYLYVLNTSSDSISVFDTSTLKAVKRLTASRNPWSLSLSPDGSKIIETNNLSRFVEFRAPSVSEITVIDVDSAVVDDRIEVPGTNLVQGIAWHPSGRFALTTMNRTKNLVPMTRLLQGWTITNGLAVIWNDGRVDQVLLDEPSCCFPDPTDLAITPDGDYALVTSSGSNRVAVVDVVKLIAMLEAATDRERQHVFPNHLGKATEFVVGHIPTMDSPRGVTISAEGRTAYVANSLNDSVTVIDIPQMKATHRIDLGGPKEISEVRWGEQLFHSANITFHRQFSCHSCHPDGHVDGLTYDIEPDGIGKSPVDNRTLRGILDTAPFKWEGTNPSLQRQCGPRLSVFFTRLAPFTPDQLAALDLYICTIPRPPNRYRPVGAELTEAQRQGKAMFERTRTNAGALIPKENRCVTCHFPPLFTDRQRHDVGTKMKFDREARFDVPHLSNIYDSAPYLHNGIAETLEQIWTEYNPYDEHGVTNDMTKDQLNHLIEYLKTL